MLASTEDDLRRFIVSADTRRLAGPGNDCPDRRRQTGTGNRQSRRSVTTAM
jgi:hypothetical protein